jgi:hypothetical protein
VKNVWFSTVGPGSTNAVVVVVVVGVPVVVVVVVPPPAVVVVVVVGVAVVVVVVVGATVVVVVVVGDPQGSIVLIVKPNPATESSIAQKLELNAPGSTTSLSEVPSQLVQNIVAGSELLF